jgi:hypothetical protein
MKMNGDIVELFRKHEAKAKKIASFVLMTVNPKNKNHHLQLKLMMKGKMKKGHLLFQL